MMMFRSKRIVILLAAALLVAVSVRAQRLEWEVNASGFFDNSEGEGTYRTDDTYGGIHLQPLLSAVESRGRHRITAGYDAFVEWGADNRLDANGLMAFYEYSSGPLRILMGKYPRRKMLQEWPDYLICDSIKYFRPSQTGFDIQYVRPKGHVEVFLDWTAKRTETVREQFMVGFDGRYAVRQFQMGINGYYYHYANELHGAEMGHKPHDNAVVHPYVGFCWQHPGVLELARRVHEGGYNLWCYTGHTWEEITSDPHLLEVVQLCDVVVEGRFVLAQRDTSLRFRGSKNQRIIDVRPTLATGDITLFDGQNNEIGTRFA